MSQFRPHEDLISVNPLLDKGFKLTMEADRGELVNEETGVTIGVKRVGAKWSVDLDDVAAASASIPTWKVTTNSAVLSKPKP